MVLASVFSELGTFLAFCFFGLMGIALLVLQQMSYDPAIRERNMDWVRQGVEWWKSRQ